MLTIKKEGLSMNDRQKMIEELMKHPIGVKMMLFSSIAINVGNAAGIVLIFCFLHGNH